MTGNKRSEKEIFITEISEEDFRKLNLVAYKRKLATFTDENNEMYQKMAWVPVNLNQLLEENINFLLHQGYLADLEDLKTPITVAIHKENSEEPADFYYEKYMNMYSGASTFYLAFGIKHLYSTRDYFECHEDYWKVKKNETKAIYRIHLDEKWVNQFKLKHKKEIIERFDDNHYIEGCYDLDEKTDEWVLSSKAEIIKTNNCCQYHPIPIESKDKK